VGFTTSDDFDIVVNNGEFDYFAVKFDTIGNIIWKKNYGGSLSDICYSVVETPEGNYMLAGESFSNDGDVTATQLLKNVWLLLVNSDGEILSQKTYGGSINETAKSIIINEHGNYVICGETNSNDGDVSGNHLFGTYDFWVAEIDPDFVLIRQNCFGGTEDDKPHQIIITPTGEYFCVGYAESNDGDVSIYDANTRIWGVKIDSLLNLSWEYGYGGLFTDIGYSAAVTLDTNIVILGETYSVELPGYIGGLKDCIIIKLDINGNVIWRKMFGGTDSESGNHIIITNSNTLLFTGLTRSSNVNLNHNNGFNDFFAAEINSDGDFLSTISIGGSNEDAGLCIIGSNINNFVMTGWSRSSNFDITDNYGSEDAIIIKVAECNNIYYLDSDSDGYGTSTNDSTACSLPTGFVFDSTDCNDSDPDIHPLLLDFCNTIDDNCNGATDEDAIFITYYLDNDGDFFGDILFDSTSCNVLVGYVENSDDCNDVNAEINPLMSEVCNGIDDNCNIEVDEGLTIYTMYADVDGDTFGNPDAAVDTCIETIAGYVNNSLDCNDTIADIYPGAIELCNYLDDDCDGLADENLTYILSYQDNDGDNYGNPLIDSLSCELPIGYVEDDTDCDDTNGDIYPGAEEVLNGLDDDCDKLADEGLSIENLDYGFNIYPNPTQDFIYISNTLGLESSYSISTTQGGVLLNETYFTSIVIIDVKNYASGMYLLIIQTEFGILTHTFIKK
ncbi:MAG: T9SS type A sorting domain-containing protein, partial [Bacteroidetes bacterium]|nr:T9SS type A sorting domain-containing protein [Bacteroidota bacterium]